MKIEIKRTSNVIGVSRMSPDGRFSSTSFTITPKLISRLIAPYNAKHNPLGQIANVDSSINQQFVLDYETQIDLLEKRLSTLDDETLHTLYWDIPSKGLEFEYSQYNFGGTSNALGGFTSSNVGLFGNYNYQAGIFEDYAYLYEHLNGLDSSIVRGIKEYLKYLKARLKFSVEEYIQKTILSFRKHLKALRRKFFYAYLINKKEATFKILRTLFRSFDDEEHFGGSHLKANLLLIQNQIHHEQRKFNYKAKRGFILK